MCTNPITLGLLEGLCDPRIPRIPQDDLSYRPWDSVPTRIELEEPDPLRRGWTR